MSSRIRVISVDITHHPPDGRYDTVIARSLIQVFSAEESAIALQNIAEAVSPRGMLYIIGYFVDDSRLTPALCVAHNLMFLNLYEDGRAHSESQYRDWLDSAGFEVQRLAYGVFPDGSGMISARKK